MARSADYIEQSFGSFRIADSIAHGSKAEVYACRHETTGLYYVLRLPLADHRLWTGQPVVPPVNAILERQNAQATWSAAQIEYPQSLAARRRDKRAFIVVSPAIYGVLNQRYLIPVASPVRLKGAWDVDRLLDAIPADAVDGHGPMEGLILQMAATAPRTRSTAKEVEEWRAHWGPLLGGPIAAATAERYLKTGEQAYSDKRTAVRLVAESQESGPELAENILLRMCSAVARGKMSPQDAKATLRCEHFRANVTAHELTQLIAAYRVLSEEFIPDKENLVLLEYLLVLLSNPPADPIEHASDFEIRRSQGNLSRFELYLQEFVGIQQQVLTLEVTRS
jgi:hypothetical protein